MTLPAISKVIKIRSHLCRWIVSLITFCKHLSFDDFNLVSYFFHDPSNIMVLKEEIRASDIKKNGFNETSFFLFACC